MSKELSIQHARVSMFDMPVFTENKYGYNTDLFIESKALTDGKTADPYVKAEILKMSNDEILLIALKHDYNRARELIRTHDFVSWTFGYETGAWPKDGWPIIDMVFVPRHQAASEGKSS